MLSDQAPRRTFRTARLSLLTYEEYPDRWDEIASIFSKEAVLSGSLERYAEETKRKRGTQSVDSAFLREIEGWKSALASRKFYPPSS